MPHLLLNLRDVPDDEADEVRDLLHKHEIDFYETPPHHWGVSAGGIWVRHDADAHHARALFDNYQRKRAMTAREDYLAAEREGRADTFFSMLRRHPGRVLFVTGLALGLLLLITLPFWQFARG